MTKITEVIAPKDERGNDPNDHREDPDYIAKLEPVKTDPIADLINQYSLTDTEADMFKNAAFVVPGLIPENHLIAIIGHPGSGKTTISQELARGMVKSGFRVIYVNADIAASDACEFRERCRQHGVYALFPDMKVGRSMADVVENLEHIKRSTSDLNQNVFIIDTLKKCADVIHKGSVKRILNLFRGLTAKGATVIVLGHTNKYDGPDGKPIFEGTGDIKSDVDELFYLVSEKQLDGTMTVSMEPDKVRADIQKATFRIDPDRNVQRLGEFIDIKARKERHKQMDKDADIIESIEAAIRAGKTRQKDIIAACRDDGVSRNKALDCLKRWAKGEHKLWVEQPAMERNSKIYVLVEN